MVGEQLSLVACNISGSAVRDGALSIDLRRQPLRGPVQRTYRGGSD